MKFGDILWEVMKRENVSQAELSRMTSIPRGNISRYVQGECKPNFDTAKFIFNTMGYEIVVRKKKC